jgi:hypothetical protein
MTVEEHLKSRPKAKKTAVFWNVFYVAAEKA